MPAHGELRRIHQPASISDILALMRNEYGYSDEHAAALHEDMSVYAYDPALGMNAGIFYMTEYGIAERFKTEFTALTGVYGAPIKQIKEKK